MDADLIKNITNTHARLTMYDLSLVNPEIEVINTDGSSGDSSIVSNLNYSGGVLTFEAAHFTTFKAKEKSISTHYSSPVISTTGVPSCPDLSPHNSPDLFEIAVTKDQATLYLARSPDQFHITILPTVCQREMRDMAFGFPLGIIPGLLVLPLKN